MQFAAHRERLDALDRPRGRVLEILIAQLTAVVGNTGFRGFAEPQTTRSFMLTKLPEPKPERKRRLTKKDREAVAGGFRDLFFELMKKQGGN